MEIKDHFKQFFQLLPKEPSHDSRKERSKVYLEQIFISLSLSSEIETKTVRGFNLMSQFEPDIHNFRHWRLQLLY